MAWLVALLAALHSPIAEDSARLVGSTLVVDSLGLSIDLPPTWLGAKDSVAWPPSCGRELHGPFERRLVTSRSTLDSLRNLSGEWDREYAAVADSTLPLGDLLAQLGPEPMGAGLCFADLQMRGCASMSAPLRRQRTVRQPRAD